MKDRFLNSYLSTNSPSGNEQEVQKLWLTEMLKSLPTNVSYKSPEGQFGNASVTLSGKSPEGTKKHVVVGAHVDEISWRITQIEPSGRCRVTRNGGTDETTAPGSRVVLFNPFKKSEDEVYGVFGQKAIHLRDSKVDTPKIESLYVDFGFSSKEEAEKVVTVGDLVCYEPLEPLMLSNDILTSKALDNKIGGYIIFKVAEKVRDLNLDNLDITFLNTVQEETGLRGAKLYTQSNNYDYAIITDVTHSTDTPGINKAKAGEVELGKGAVISRGALLDDNLISLLDKDILDKAQFLACRHSTGTDSDEFALSNGGKSVALISTPLRYMHTQTETVSMKDVESVIEAITALLKALNEKEVDSVN